MVGIRECGGKVRGEECWQKGVGRASEREQTEGSRGKRKEGGKYRGREDRRALER